MATFIPNLTDVFPQSVPFQPDFNFLDTMLRRKQAQYEEGVSRAASARDMIRNAPLSDFANVELRDKYLKEADEALKKISSADFSLPQNVDSAMSIYSPFWEDSLMLMDMQKTKMNNNSLSELSSWKNSKDEKIRAQYSDIAYQYVMNDVEKLRNANRDAEKYKDVEGRPAVPFTNIEKYLDDEAAKEPDKLKIVWDEANGPALYRIENGERSVKNFKTWAQSKIGNNFVGQFRVTGIVKTENDKKEVRKLHPEYTEQQLSEEIARKHVSQLKQGHERRLQEVDQELARINDLVAKIPAVFDESKAPAYMSLVDQRNQLVNYKEQLRLKYDQFDQKSQDRIYKSVLENPERYYATLAEQTVIDNWSAGKASIASRKIEKNEPYIEAMRLQIERMKEDNQRVKNQIDLIKEMNNPRKGTQGAELKNPVKKQKDENLDGVDDDTGETIEGYDQENGGRFLGRTITDISANLPSAWDRYTTTQQDLFNSANNAVFDPSGVINLAKKGLGLTEREVALVSTAYRRHLSGEGKLFKNRDNEDDEETKALDKFHTALYTDKGVADAVSNKKLNSNADLGVEALLKYVENQLTNRSALVKEGKDIPFTDDENKSLMSYIISRNMLDTYWANENSRKELVERNIVNSNDPKLLKLLVDKNGKKDMVSISDVAKMFGNLQVKGINKDGIETTLTAEDVARAYMNGNVKAYTPTSAAVMDNFAGPSTNYYLGYTITKDGINYNVGEMRNSLIKYPNNTLFDRFLTKMGEVVTRFGTSTDIKKDIQAANEKVVPNLLFYKKQSGNIGGTFGYNFNPKTLGDPAAVVFLEALQPGNVKNIMYDNGLNSLTPVPVAEQAVIRNLLKDENNIEKYVGGFEYNTIGVNGKPTISFSLNPVDKEIKIGDKTLDQMTGMRIRVELSPTAEGPMMKGLPNPTGQYVFSKILRGESIEADPIMKAAGFQFTVDPDNTDGNPNYVTIKGNYFKRVIQDETTGKLVNNMVETPFSARYNLKGENSRSPDEIMNFVFSLFNSAIKMNYEKQKEYERLSTMQITSTGQLSLPGMPTTTSPVSRQRTRADLGLSN